MTEQRAHNATAGAATMMLQADTTVAVSPVQTRVAVRDVVPRSRAQRRLRRSLRDTLLEEPSRFTFDAAVSVLMRASGNAEPGEAIRFHAPPGLAFAAADVLAVAEDGTRFRLTTGLLGLTGPGGVLPRPYTELVNGEHRRRSPTLGAFLDILAQRPLAQFAAAGIKYRPHRSADAAAIAAAARQAHAAAPVAKDGAAGPGAQDGYGIQASRDRPPQDGMRAALTALAGFATPGLAERLVAGIDPMLFYAGAFAARPRSADRLAAILSDWLGERVEVEQFSGTWLRIAPDQMSRLPASGVPGRFNRLGVDAAVGARAWDLQSRIMLRVGPLSLEAFRALLPGRQSLRLLCALAQTYLEGGVDFRVNAVLAKKAVPALALDPAAPPHLGWATWLPTRGPRRKDASEPVFGAEGAAR